ncbi:MAG: helix-turn-helix transcriptional regulator [Lachnospiraceae bacterium]|nr:helix-turn-helix transcriptional regulator [Lachnospiraceae bacterium]MEE0686678.1 helix-turn-helix transcriptional regulator [Lachnospiraceae bacterium]MEE0861857.1 helix-turn-helix transcriptional regulator [Lachnospiraceae bacterium]
MMHAYDEMYLEKARIALGRMFDFVVYQLGYSIEKFFDLFISSGVSRRFENGDVDLLVGKSGVEIGYEVLDKTFGDVQPIEIEFTVNRSEEYWTGWVLAYYQWMYGISFSKINEKISIRDILALYTPYHEMDIRQVVDKLDEMMINKDEDTNLKKRRKAAGLSQSGLAKEVGVSVRTIQQYEQRQKDINKASAERMLAFAKRLYCDVEDLME